MRTTNIIAMLVVALVAGCAADDGTSHLKLALAGEPDQTTAQAAAELAPVLDAADWYYLANAEWPADVDTVVADPRLQKAMMVFAPHSLSSRVAAPAAPSSPPQMQALLDASRRLMQAANGHPSADGLASAAAFAQAMGQAAPRPLPPPGNPADGATEMKTITFYKDGTSTTETTVVPFCCKGVLTFPGGKFECQDATSCKGGGEPPPGGVSVINTGDGGGGSSFVCAKTNPQVQCEVAATCTLCAVSACGGPNGTACSFAATSDGMHEMSFGTDCGPKSGCPGAACNSTAFNACVNEAIQQAMSQCGCT